MNLLLGIDQSAHAQAALKSILYRDWPDETTVRVLCVAEPIELTRANRDEISNETLKELEDAQHEAAKTSAKNAESALRDKFGVNNVSSEVWEGNAGEVFLEAASGWPASLVVLGSHGTTSPANVHIGSVVRTLMQYSPCSMEIIKSDDSSDEGNKARWSRAKVLIPIEDSETAEAAFESVLNGKWSPDCQFRLLRIEEAVLERYASRLSLKALNLGQYHKKFLRGAEKLLEQKASLLKDRLSTQNVSTKVFSGDDRESIVNEAREWSADLLIMGSHGKRGLSRLIMGNVHQAIALHAPCSVRIVKTGKSDTDRNDKPKRLT